MRVTKNKKLSDPSHPEFGRCINFCLCASCKSAAGSRDLIRVGFNSFGWLLSELTEAVGTNEQELSIPRGAEEARARGRFLPWIMAGMFHEFRAAGQGDTGAGLSRELYTGGA